MPVASFSSNFVGHIVALADIEKRNGEADLATNQRKWNLPGINQGWNGNPLDITGMNLAFQRDDINDLHCVSMTSSARLADSMAMKRQADYMAAEERAYRLRHATGIRCNVHSAARLVAHGHGNGVYHNGVLGYIQDGLAAGYNGGQTGQG